jgi:hypothetical protein
MERYAVGAFFLGVPIGVIVLDASKAGEGVVRSPLTISPGDDVRSTSTLPLIVKWTTKTRKIETVRKNTHPLGLFGALLRVE